MDNGKDLSEAELNEVFDHLQSMMDAVSRVRTMRSDPEQRRTYLSRYFEHLAKINRLTPLTNDRP
jgi:hypothetical protein